MFKKSIFIAGTTLLLLVVSVGVWFYFYALNNIVIVNTSAFPIQNAQMVGANKLVWHGEIPARGRVAISFLAEKDGGEN